eukprot:6092028-Prymnesium_polylepis.1
MTTVEPASKVVAEIASASWKAEARVSRPSSPRARAGKGEHEHSEGGASAEATAATTAAVAMTQEVARSGGGGGTVDCRVEERGARLREATDVEVRVVEGGAGVGGVPRGGVTLHVAWLCQEVGARSVDLGSTARAGGGVVTGGELVRRRSATLHGADGGRGARRQRDVAHNGMEVKVTHASGSVGPREVVGQRNGNGVVADHWRWGRGHGCGETHQLAMGALSAMSSLHGFA